MTDRLSSSAPAWISTTEIWTQRRYADDEDHDDLDDDDNDDCDDDVEDEDDIDDFNDNIYDYINHIIMKLM